MGKTDYRAFEYDRVLDAVPRLRPNHLTTRDTQDVQRVDGRKRLGGPWFEARPRPLGHDSFVRARTEVSSGPSPHGRSMRPPVVALLPKVAHENEGLWSRLGTK